MESADLTTVGVIVADATDSIAANANVNANVSVKTVKRKEEERSVLVSELGVMIPAAIAAGVGMKKSVATRNRKAEVCIEYRPPLL